MIGSRSLGSGLELFQVIEFHGPTHDAQWMLPGLEASTLDSNMRWLSPDFWMSRTNRLVFTFQMWILQSSDRVVVIDTGVGNFKQRVAPSQNMLNNPAIDWLKAIGAGPDEVTDVIHTHLHGDHVGWNTQLVDGRWEPTFPKATYHLPRLDWESYRQRIANETLPQVFAAPMIDSVIPIVEAGLARFISEGDEAAGLRAHDAPRPHARQPVLLARSWRRRVSVYRRCNPFADPDPSPADQQPLVRVSGRCSFKSSANPASGCVEWIDDHSGAREGACRVAGRRELGALRSRSGARVGH